MKKILSLFIGVLLVVSMLGVSVFATETAPANITGTFVEAKAGETVTIEFKIENNTGFDSTKMKATVAAPLSMTKLNTGLLNTAPNLKSESEAIISHASTAITSNGVLFSVNVKVADDAVAGTYPVNLEVVRLNIKNGDESVAVAHTVVKGYVKVAGEPAPEHKHDFKPVETVEPTCTEAGYVLHKCECGETMKEELKALGHAPNTEWKYNTKQHWHICDRCGVEVEHDDHTLVKYEKYVKCSICPYTYDITGDDDEPETGDITASITFGTVAMISVAAAAAYVASRKFAK